MANTEKFLPPGTVLVTSNRGVYRIRHAIASGGSAIVYESEIKGTHRMFVLKECFPDSKKFAFIRKGITVTPKNPDDIKAADYLKLIKSNMERENLTGQIIATATGRAIASWDKLDVTQIIIGEKVYDAADSCFIVMERATDADNRRGIFFPDLLAECAKTPTANAPLRTGGNPSPLVATMILEELLKSLRDIHKAGYIHGDINEANFFLMGHDFKRGDIGVGQLLDFGSARKILPDGMTEPLDDVFSTPGYWSPEIFMKSSAPIRLTAATDIYSVGCLMLYTFYGMKYKKARGKNLAGSECVPSVSVDEAVRHGYRRNAAELFTAILSKALQFKPEDRYQNGAEMLDDILRLKNLITPPKFLLAENLTRSPYFVDGSRDAEIADLQKDLERGTHPLFIFGVGGIGKTELANEFARTMIKNGTPSFLVTFKGNMRDTILSLRFSGYEADTPESENDYRRRIDLLKEYYQGCLLIVDNFDDDEKSLATLMNEPACLELINETGLKILFTTRSRPNESAKELQPLDKSNAMTLFKSISPVAADDEPIVLELIREVDCHPMTVELLAKTREDSWQTISYKELLQRLRHRGMDDINLPTVTIKKNLTEREAKIYGHLRTLFNICRLGEDYRQAICHATLLPIDGFDAATFITNEDDAQKIQLKTLEAHSWIRRHKENNRLTIHPLIRTVFRNELRPTDDDCNNFLRRIWNIADNDFAMDLEFFRQAAELFERATNDLADKRGDFAFYAGYCFIVTGKILSATRCEEKAVKIREIALADNPRELARTYNDAAVAAMSSENFGVYSDAGLAEKEGSSALGGDFDRGIDYLTRARKILETLPDVEDLQNLANVCASIATALCNREDVDNALPLAQKAVDIFTAHPSKNLYERAHAHQALGQILILKKKYGEALNQRKLAVNLIEQLFQPPHPVLATAYRELAEVYALLKDFASAETNIIKAINMYAEIFPDTHPDVLAAYKIAMTLFAESGKTDKAKYYADRANDIFLRTQAAVWKNKLAHAERMIEVAEVPVDENLRNNPTVAQKLLASKSRDILRYSRDAADACRQLKNYDKATKFINAAMEKFSDRTAPIDMATTLFTAAQISFDCGKFDESAQFDTRAAKILAESTPTSYDRFCEVLIHLGNVFAAKGDHNAALNAFTRAVNAQKENPYPENAAIELATRSMAESLMRLNRFTDAATILEELLAKQQNYLFDTNPRIVAVRKLLARARENSAAES